MGKKKNKFNKKPNRPLVTDRGEINTFVADESEAQENDTMTLSAAGASGPAVEIAVDPRYLLIRKEVKQVLLTILILFLILIGAYFLEAKTGALDKMGAWIYRISNIQTQ